MPHRKPQQQAGLSDSRVSDQQQLEQIITVNMAENKERERAHEHHCTGMSEFPPQCWLRVQASAKPIDYSLMK
jgi:hypothetical protein